jgi:glyoxylase-like metal-dependent hydrolase (beta-lactamase superfamily II)
MNRVVKKICRIALFFCLIAASANAQETPLELKVITSSAGSLYTNSSLITGEEDMVLVDAPFTRSDAHRLVADLLETGKNLKYIYVTHDHPDHFFSMEVITQAFPAAQVISAPQVVADIWASIPYKIERWGPMLGPNGPRYPTAPTAWEADYFELEGHRIEIIGPMQGDHRHATALYVPALNALITGDITFHGIHVWLGEHLAEQRAAWIETLDRLIALEPEIVVAGHKLPQLDDDPSSLVFTRDYIITFGRLAEQLETSEDLIAAMRAEYPELQDVIDDFILVNSAKVAVGEMPPWEE